MSTSASAEQVQIPDGFRLHTENTSHILLSANEAFLNPVQEFNRDLSIACIRTWSDDLNKVKEEKWKVALEKRLARKRLKSMSCRMLKILPFVYWVNRPENDGRSVVTGSGNEGDLAKDDETFGLQSKDDEQKHEVR